MKKDNGSKTIKAPYESVVVEVIPFEGGLDIITDSWGDFYEV